MASFIKRGEPRKTLGMLKDLKEEISSWTSRQGTLTAAVERLTEAALEHRTLQDQVRSLVLDKNRDLAVVWSGWTEERSEAYLERLKADLSEMKE